MYKTVGVDGAVATNGEYANASKYVYVSSVAGTILLTECVVVDDPKDEKKDDSSSLMGGMY